MSIQNFQVFELPQVARIVGIKSETAKNWVNGRVLKIEPSIRRASGQGTRNLFSENDIYKFLFAREAMEFGLTSKIIEKLLPLIDADISKPWLFFRCAKGEWKVEARKEDSPIRIHAKQHKGFTFSLDLRVFARKIEAKKKAEAKKRISEVKKGGSHA